MTLPIEIALIIPPAGRTVIAGGQAVLDLSTYPLGDNVAISSSGVTIGGATTGIAAPEMNMNKTAGGAGGVVWKEANAKRASVLLNSSENLVLEVFTGAEGAEASAGSVTINGATGAVTLTGALTVAGTITANGTLDVNGNLDLAGATVVAPFVAPRWYTSQEIDFADLGSGATDAIALTGLPAGSWHVLAVHVETGAETTSSSGDTTGLTLQVGHTGGNVDALVESISIFGAASKKVAPRGVEVGGYVDFADDVEALFTAVGGGSEDLDDINAMRVKIAFLLAPAPAITFS